MVVFDKNVTDLVFSTDEMATLSGNDKVVDSAVLNFTPVEEIVVLVGAFVAVSMIPDPLPKLNPVNLLDSVLSPKAEMGFDDTVSVVDLLEISVVGLLLVDPKIFVDVEVGDLWFDPRNEKGVEVAVVAIAAVNPVFVIAADGALVVEGISLVKSAVVVTGKDKLVVLVNDTAFAAAVVGNEV